MEPNVSFTDTTAKAVSDVADQTGQIARSAKRVGETVKGVAQQSLGKVQSAASDAFEKSRTSVRNAKDTVEYGIISRPFTSVLIALGAGIVIGGILSHLER